MTIVSYAHRPKRKRRVPKAQSAAMIGSIIVTGRKLAVELKHDPEADARVAAWFAKNIRPPEG